VSASVWHDPYFRFRALWSDWRCADAPEVIGTRALLTVLTRLAAPHLCQAQIRTWSCARSRGRVSLSDPHPLQPRLLALARTDKSLIGASE
jgi:hypothetical protein